MTYREWKIWVKSKPWLLRWFIFLVLLRPLIDSLYFLKNVSPLVSPPYLAGVLTPIICLIAIQRFRRQTFTSFDRHFRRLSIFMLLGITLVVLYNPLSLAAMENLLKLSLPIVLFFFMRRFIRSRRDLDGLLQTFLYSCILVVFTLIYELAFGPIRVEESRGFERIQGNFGDVTSYGIYIVFSFLIATYFYFIRKNNQPFRKRIRLVLVVGFFGLLGAANIHHVATYIILGALFLLFFIFNLRTDYNAAFLMAMGAFMILVFFGQDIFTDRIAPLLEMDQRVFSGEADINRLAHGRVGRWGEMWTTFTDQNMVAQFIGYPATMRYSYNVVGSGAHNDYIRILFLSGYLGLISYLVVLWSYFRRSRRLMLATRYLALGVLAILCMFSISITPTFYPPFMYLAMALFAYIALPQKKRETTTNG